MFDHTSIAKTIASTLHECQSTGYGGAHGRSKRSVDGTSIDSRQQTQPSIAVPPAPARNAALARKAAPSPDSNDFKEVLQSHAPVTRFANRTVGKSVSKAQCQQPSSTGCVHFGLNISLRYHPTL